MKQLIALILCLVFVYDGRTQMPGDFSFPLIKHRDIDHYYQLHKRYIAELCPAGTEEEFNRLFKDFRGEGWPVPLMSDGLVDIKSIEGHLPSLQKKVDWIKHQKSVLKNHLDYPKFLEIRGKVEKLISENLDYKTLIEHKKNSDPVIAQKAKQKIIELREAFRDLIDHIPFLLTYGFPVDHLEDRRIHEQLREATDPKVRQIANRKTLQRSLYEDGAQDPDHSNSDVFLRMAINTAYLQSLTDVNLMSEKLRTDLEYILNGIDRQFKKGEDQIFDRLEEWEDRTLQGLHFYLGVLKNPESSGQSLVHARGSLQNFVGKKNAKAVKFWLSQEPRLISLFVLETIFANEVGEMDSQDGIERLEVGRVVLNRVGNQEYHILNPDDALLSYLQEEGLDAAAVNKNPWIGVLFKQGEFSFTYYFLSASVKTVCPDLSPRGKSLRNRNLSLAWDLLDRPDDLGKAIRYFSRTSMKGRIDMSSIWGKFAALPERPGRAKQLNPYWSQALQNGLYRFLYSFTDPQGRKSDVVVLDGEKIIWQRGRENGLARDQTFFYRDPDLFRYFASK